MHPKLTNVFISDIAGLRQLIVSSMETIFISFQILDLEAPLPGKPILLLNQDNCLVIISFDLHDRGNALLSGLRASEKLLDDILIFERLYPALRRRNSDLRERTELLLLTPADKTNQPGLDLFNEKISAYTFRGIGVNGETMLMIEPETPLFSPSSGTASFTTRRKGEPNSGNEDLDFETLDLETKVTAPSNGASELSADETLFFQRL